MDTAHRVVMVGFEQAALMDVACVSDTLDVANMHGAEPRYDVRLASLRGRTVLSSSGIVLLGDIAVERLRDPIDTLVVADGSGRLGTAGHAELVRQIRRLAALSGRVASVCDGAVLAEAGLLDGRQATANEAAARVPAARYAAAPVEAPSVFFVDGPVSGTAGAVGALDLTLALIEADHGPELARSVARFLASYVQPSGNQAQMSIHVRDVLPEHKVLRRIVLHIGAHPAGDLTNPALAARAGVSERHLSRLFLDHLGQSPARFVRTARVEAAARLLETTVLPLATVARRCGFGSTETLRSAFQDCYGTSPSVYRVTLRGPHRDHEDVPVG
ncbi:helix-turn-helix domain-containing protein [Streptomyces sp. IBSBF 2953]|uniref:GlxA family transcriptional regulator n=1 Tax=Streptomyces TaxID=1883 RepID=UPI002119DF48|nr:helix-turn-helix domain-containing protein [Streptomyces scabiei]MCQ9183293.1 helix-turn-helix domain-containing protein [Streptomyces hayashii]MDX3117795.1 helix-turn-helix domain-containing protein [Streptomyces scabiei]